MRTFIFKYALYNLSLFNFYPLIDCRVDHRPKTKIKKTSYPLVDSLTHPPFFLVENPPISSEHVAFLPPKKNYRLMDLHGLITRTSKYRRRGRFGRIRIPKHDATRFLCRRIECVPSLLSVGLAKFFR